MSRFGDPYDNAIAEKFFLFLKRVIYRIKLKPYDEASLIIEEYIHCYNTQRMQLKTKLFPHKFRSWFTV